MTENIKVNIDVSSGNVGIECPEGSLEMILGRVAEFMPKLAEIRSAKNPENETVPSHVATEVNGTNEATVNSKRGSKRPPVYKMTDLGIDDNARRDFKKFFDSKKPKSQNDQVLVCAFWLNKVLKRDTFTENDVFTALRTAGVPKVPARIESVISNLKLETKLVGERGKYQINHIGEDFINNLPQATVTA